MAEAAQRHQAVAENLGVVDLLGTHSVHCHPRRPIAPGTAQQV